MNMLAPIRKGRPFVITDQEIRDGFGKGMRDEEMAAQASCSAITVYKRRCALGLFHPKGRPVGTVPIKISRHDPKKLQSKPAKLPPFDHPAIVDGHTIYPHTLFDPKDAINLLVAGENSWKIGGKITKGKWKGYPIFTLTLEERATCPTSCRHWRSCFGNQMNWARRLKHGAALEDRLLKDLSILQRLYPNGFAVRLHVLGDFYSVEYVQLWKSFLSMFPALHVFGFSARWEKSDPIGLALVKLVMEKWQRFAIRFSNAPVDECSTVSIEYPGHKPDDAIICPQQLGKTQSCGTCGLCWHTRRRIAFLQH